jgi:two-component system cell cycle response regulator DivK
MTSPIGLIKDCFKGWTILLAEDDDDAMVIAMRWFRLAGAEVLVAGDGRAALEMAQRHHPTLIMSDLHMPIMDGWNFCETLKRDEKTHHIPVIALSADRTTQSVQQTHACGFDGFIHKPLDPNKFVNELLDIVNSLPELAGRRVMMVRES